LIPQSVVIVIDSIVSVSRNYERRKVKKTGGKWQVVNRLALSSHPQQATTPQPLHRFHEFCKLGALTGNIPLCCSLAHGKDVFKYVLSHSLLVTKILATMALVCPVSKATRTRSQAKRELISLICCCISFLMIGSRSGAYFAERECCRASSSRAEPTEESDIPSVWVIRCSSAFTLGLTHKPASTRCFLRMGLFCERGVFVPDTSVRVRFVTVTGWRVAGRTDEVRTLSCTTSPWVRV
jgi:hypothetical protein